MAELISHVDRFGRPLGAPGVVHGASSSDVAELMASAAADRTSRNSGGIMRRDVLRLSAGLGLSMLLPPMDLRAADKRGSERAKSLIVLWMAGGPSQMETWDPHPEVSSKNGDTKVIKTSVPDLKIGSDYPRMAEQMQHMTVIRSLVSKEGDHERGTYFLKTGWRIDPSLRRPHPALGAILTSELPDKRVEIPLHFSLGQTQWPARGGFIGDEYDAFKIFDPGRNIRNMQPPVSLDRQTRRLASLDVATKAFSQGRRLQMRSTKHGDTIQRALRMMSSKQLDAFDLSKNPTEIAAYGDTQFGRGCLVASKLVAEGVRAIEVTLRGFDTHTDNFNGHRTQAEILDPAFSALISDLKANELFDSTVVLCIGEFGRTPTINKLSGRDHFPHWFSCVIGGGGLSRGLVIGETNADLTEQQQKEGLGVKDPIKVQDLLATIYSRFGVDHTGSNYTSENRPMRIVDGSPIARLMARSG